MFLHIGLDDTDSEKGMCTTYIMAKIIDEIGKRGLGRLVGYPKLIRLNPTCPYKTRGNAALAALFETDNSVKIKELTIRLVSELAELEEEGTDPGIVFYDRKMVPDEVSTFSDRAVKEMVELEEALSLIKKYGMEYKTFKKGIGVIGALAAIGNKFPHGRTYELIAYRVPEYRGKPRLVDTDSVFLMDEKTRGCTFDNLDPESEEIKITPHTPCPVLFGIRALRPECLKKALKLVKVAEPIERYMIFETNQATDAHIAIKSISEIRPYTSVAVWGVISSKPKIIKGGHVFVEMKDGTGKIRLAAYEPTRGFREIVASLIPGDEVIAYGSFKPREGEPPTINLEKVRILKVVDEVKFLNPRCPKCGKRMKSEGKGKGYGCPSCGYKSKKLQKERIVMPRKIVRGMYEVPPRARRHLSKPSFLDRKT